ncbi:NAD(P)-binding protein [Cryphonectria parasitica EP155]|uniref:NAD(P)-binding protein n=1 Tax=Cryphonectria parasitica (strain ATCC 38755 / EP155) TaxID=660469 RepID=A0A9P4XTZ6_CRYP1|nr:NAD(P)-binding protein [Cryphonectria parasitica EP155]KAF3760650.1 NAD(P)-binding protein [Cryphonectria parasitica EP155]
MFRGDNLFTFLLSSISQAFPGKPTFTDKDIGDLDGKVYIVTGANTGVGKDVAQVLYAKHARVYCAARSEEKALKAIEAIRTAVPGSRGELRFLYLDLADLSTIRASAEQFLAQEDKLHVLFNNAGVMTPPQGSRTAQGYELQLGVNNVGTFLFTKLLTPVLVRTASAATAGSEASVRVVWVSSSATESPSVPTGGVDLANLDYHVDKSAFEKYATSKAGNYLQGVEFARRHRADGVVSVPLNPGNLSSDLWRNLPGFVVRIMTFLVLNPPVYGAYTELFAGLSPDVTIERSGKWVVPWGRFARIRKHMYDGGRPVSEGGTGQAEKFWEWQEEQVRPFL